MKLLRISCLLALLIVTISCAHKVTRIDPSETPDISGKWNNTDKTF